MSLQKLPRVEVPHPSPRRNDVGMRRGDDVEGCYAWLIVGVSLFGHVLIYGVSWSAGVFYEIFKSQFDGSSGAIALIAALNTAFLFGSGPVSGILTTRFGHRVVAISGGLIAALGLVLSAYATQIYQLYLTFGILTGFGFGVAYIPVVSIVPPYFRKHRPTALGLAVCGAGLGTFIYPPAIHRLLIEFGWRGALLIIGGVTLNLCVCGALMRPPQELECKKNQTTLQDTSKANIANEDAKLKLRRCQDKIKRALYLNIFQSKPYIILCANNFLLMIAISVVYVHLPAFSETKNVSRYQSPMLISTIGIANLIGRLSFGLLGHVPHLTSQRLYIAGTTFAGVAILCMPASGDFIHLIIVSAIFGFMSGSIGPLLPQLLSEFLNTELLPTGYGYLLIFEAMGNLMGPSAAGWLYDVTSYYPWSFYFVGVAMVIAGLIMLVPLFLPKTPLEDITGDITDMTCDQTEYIDATEEKLMLQKKDERLA